MADKQVNLKDLIKQREELEAQINLIQTTQRNNAVEQVQAMIAEHGLTVIDVFPQFGQKVQAKTAVRKGEPRPVMFRDPVSGKAWTGKGRRPGWLPEEGKPELEQFRVAQ